MRVQTLFQEGTRFTVWPLRVTYRRESSEEVTQVLVWAPKALFRHAVDRNRLRRQMREAYRNHKSPIENLGLQVAFNYMDKQMQPYGTIEKAMQRAVAKLLQTRE